MDILENRQSVIKVRVFELPDGYIRTEPVGSVNQNKLVQTYISRDQLQELKKNNMSKNPICDFYYNFEKALKLYGSYCMSESMLIIGELRFEHKCIENSALMNRLALMDRKADQREEKASAERQQMSQTIERIDSRLTDKTDVVANKKNKGVILLRQTDERGFDVKDNEYLIYIHGGLQDRWNTFQESENYEVLYEFKNISDHDKALRLMKDELMLTARELMQPKRNLLRVRRRRYHQVRDWYLHYDKRCES